MKFIKICSDSSQRIENVGTKGHIARLVMMKMQSGKDRRTLINFDVNALREKTTKFWTDTKVKPTSILSLVVSESYPFQKKNYLKVRSFHFSACSKAVRNCYTRMNLGWEQLIASSSISQPFSLKKERKKNS